MCLARSIFRVLPSIPSIVAIIAAAALIFPLSGTARADRSPLLGSGTRAPSGTTPSVTANGGMIVAVDPSEVPCPQIATFEDVLGGDSPGTNYDVPVLSGALQFAERFMGQAVSNSGDFDVVSGTPSGPLTLQVGAAGENLDVIAYVTNALTGLGYLGYPDPDAIGEGSIAMYFPVAQSRVSFQLLGGNGGSATLDFYRADGSLIDNVVVSGLADGAFGFATSDNSPIISGILIQNTDASGIGVDDVCHNDGVVNSRSVTWGNVKRRYR